MGECDTLYAIPVRYTDRRSYSRFWRQHGFERIRVGFDLTLIDKSSATSAMHTCVIVRYSDPSIFVPHSRRLSYGVSKPRGYDSHTPVFLFRSGDHMARLCMHDRSRTNIGISSDLAGVAPHNYVEGGRSSHLQSAAIAIPFNLLETIEKYHSETSLRWVAVQSINQVKYVAVVM